MARADGAEVAAIERDHQVGPEAFRERDDGSISAAQREVGVLLDEIGDAGPVLRTGGLDVEIPKAPQERGLNKRSKSTSEQVRHLGDNEGRHDQVQISALEDGYRSSVVGFCWVRGGD